LPAWHFLAGRPPDAGLPPVSIIRHLQVYSCLR
jgi:hypothetical protein